MRFPERRIYVHLFDGTTKEMVINWIRVEDGVAYFGRDRREFLAAPLTSISYWDNSPR